jgi:hypothetical protein
MISNNAFIVHREGRSFTFDIATKRKFVFLKFYIPLSTTTDIPPTYLTIETLAYALIQHCKFNFDADITAILNFNEAVKTKKGDIYITYVFLSPRSTQIRAYNTYSANYLILHSRLLDQLRQPSPAYCNDTSLPSHITQYNITIPQINDITEKLAYIIAGFPPQFLLGNQTHINIDNLRMVGLMIHQAICEQLGQNLTNTFPQPTSRFATSYFFSLRLHQVTINGQTKQLFGLLVNGHDNIFSSITTKLTALCNTNTTFDESLPIFLI